MILGGGTGGTIAANRLRRKYSPGDAEIIVVDQDDDHVYQPGLLFVPFGLADPGRLVRPRHRQLHAGISFRQAGIDHVDVAAGQVHLDDGTVLGYEVLVIATGTRLLTDETEGLTGPRWMTNAFTFHTPAGTAALRTALDGSTAAGWWPHACPGPERAGGPLRLRRAVARASAGARYFLVALAAARPALLGRPGSHAGGRPAAAGPG